MSAAGQPCKVFLCHSGVEKHLVLQLYFALRYFASESASASADSIFLDRASLTPTRRFDRELLTALAEARIGVVWLSSAFMKAPWCLYESSLLLMQSGLLPSAQLAEQKQCLLALTLAAKQEQGFDEPWLSEWLAALPDDEASARCAVYPIFFEATALKSLPTLATPLFRLPSPLYCELLSKTSGGTNPATLTARPLLRKSIREIQSRLAPDWQMRDAALDGILDECAHTVDHLTGNETQPELNSRFAELQNSINTMHSHSSEMNEMRYSLAIQEAFGGLVEWSELLNMQNTSTKAVSAAAAVTETIRLKEVFIDQTVRRADKVSSADLGLSDEQITALIAEHELAKEEEKEGMPMIPIETPRSVRDLMRDRSVHRFVLMGHPGTGKSSALRDYALHWAEHSMPNCLEFPILVDLKRYAGRIEHMSLLDCIIDSETIHFKPTKQCWLRLLASRPVLVMLDGLDEMIEQRDVIVDRMMKFVNEYDTAARPVRICLTTRIVGYHRSWLTKHHFQNYIIQGLDNDQVQKFIEKWFSVTQPEQAATNSKHELSSVIWTQPAVKELARTPLMLTLMAIVHRAGSKYNERLALYNSIVDLWLDIWKRDLSLTTLQVPRGERDQAIADLTAFDEL